MQNSIGFIGGGHMTTAIVSGLVANTGDEYSRNNIRVSNRGPEKLAALAERYPIIAATDNEQVVAHSDVVVLSVKPQVLQSVLTPLQAVFQQHKPLIISVAAGIRCHSLVSWLGGNLSVIRAMPNTPSTIKEGATGLYADSEVSEAERGIASDLFSAIGITAWVDQEQDLNLVTAVSGSGPAYFMLFIESMVNAAMARGMSAETAKTLAVQTARGTASLIAHSDKNLADMIDDMLLPGGTTERAVAALRQHGVPSAIDAALEAANARATQLADELGD